MKKVLALLIQTVWFAAICFAAQANGSGGSPITLEGRLNCPYISSRGGMVCLQVAITAKNSWMPRRKPMNLSIVLDRSGSMADEGKIENAKKALYTLIEQLGSDDIISIVIYDDVIEVLSGAHKAVNKNAMMRLVAGIYPRGSTNLGGGMMEGFRQVERNASNEYVNRVILLSDGLANQGITNPAALERIAQRYRARSISLTTMGVGLDYNENLMSALSESGGGNYYFIEHASDLASFVRNELNALTSVAAQNASVDLTLGTNVRIKEIIGCEYRVDGNSAVIPVGDIYNGERREITAVLEIPEGTKDLLAASGVLKFESAESIHLSPSFSVVLHYTNDVAEIETHRDWEVEGKAGAAISTLRVDQAMNALDEGNSDKAAAELQSASVSLSASPVSIHGGAGAAAIKGQLQKMESYISILKDSAGDTRRAKKTIQYDNIVTKMK